MTWWLITLAALATLTACSQAPEQANELAIIDNGLNAQGQAVEAGDDRADHLDEAAQEALAASNRATGAERGALRMEAAADANEAIAARAEGGIDGARAQDDAEAGLLNKQ